MKIASYQPFSLSDFPGRASAIVFTQGCNFRCVYCHNPSLLPTHANHLIPLDEVFQFLEKRKKKLQGLVITGGEPTLQTGLVEFIRTVRDLGYAVKMDTNGSRPDVLETLFQAGLVDYVAMDIKAPPEKYPGVTRVSINEDQITSCIRLIVESAIPHEFRTTVDKNLLSPEDLSACAQWINGSQIYILQPAVYYHQECPTGPDRLPTTSVPNQPLREFNTYTSKEFAEICANLERLGVQCRVR